MDATALLAEVGVTPDELASAIRSDVKEKTGCSASVGMGEQRDLSPLFSDCCVGHLPIHDAVIFIYIAKQSLQSVL